MQEITFPIWFKDPDSKLVIKINSNNNAIVIIGDFGWKVGEQYTALSDSDIFDEICNCWVDVSEEYKNLTKFVVLASVGINANDEYSSSVNDIFCGVIDARTKEEALKLAQTQFDYEYIKYNKCHWCEHYDISYEIKPIDELKA